MNNNQKDQLQREIDANNRERAKSLSRSDTQKQATVAAKQVKRGAK